MDERLSDKNISSYIIHTQEEDIKRIALDLHEGVAQTLYSLYTGMQVIETGIDQPELKEYVGDMSGLLKKAIREIRSLAVELHPPSLPKYGLLAALKSYIQLYQSTYGIIVELKSNGVEVQISERDRITLFRVCQEALGNIARYADTAKATITLNWTKVSLSLSVTDEGKGFDIEKALTHSSGLVAMRERIHLIGGQLTISSKQMEGSSIEVYLPIPSEIN